MEKILIVDDSLLQGIALKNILCQDYEVDVCQSGEEAIEKAAATLPSLILLDIIMRGIDGFETLTRLKKQPETQNIPVILISGLSDVGNEEKGLSLGAVDYIVKPFNASIVRARVHTQTQLYSYRRTFENLAMMDGLTGIPNRRYYDDKSRMEWICAKQERCPLSIGLLDVDLFKQYNDLYGHPSGDEVLIQVAEALQKHLHCAGSFAARYGGEEFVFLMPNTAGERGSRIARKICQGIEALRILHEGSPSGVLTVSIGGVSVIPGEGQLYPDCFQMVDDMLYRAKKKGRNTVVWAEHDMKKEQEKEEGDRV